ncbi:hypothetical protein [Pseudoalteromonas sp. OOF1S-7]|nr:hypothetical protein [Pseudoalteromonas sp. OOF1S-7]
MDTFQEFKQQDEPGTLLCIDIVWNVYGTTEPDVRHAQGVW